MTRIPRTGLIRRSGRRRGISTGGRALGVGRRDLILHLILQGALVFTLVDTDCLVKKVREVGGSSNGHDGVLDIGFETFVKEKAFGAVSEI